MDSLTFGLVSTIPLILLFVGLTATSIKSHFVTLAALIVTALLACIVWKMTSARLASSMLEGGLIALIPIIWVILAAVEAYIRRTPQRRRMKRNEASGFFTKSSMLLVRM